jgi:hypothetical protein
MAREQSERTDAQWEEIAFYYPNSRPRQAAARAPSPIGLASKASSGSCGAEHDGKTCRRGFRLLVV